MILCPEPEMRVRVTRSPGPAFPVGRMGKVVSSIGMLAMVYWEDRKEMTQINGAYLEHAVNRKWLKRAR
jgi:hypothetical protein